MSDLILYHGTSWYFDSVSLVRSRSEVDFGVGFYTTSDYKQAYDWALRSKRSALVKGIFNPTAYVYSFKVDKKVLNKLNIHRFNSMSISWLDYVVYNRLRDERFNNLDGNFDLIVGDVADAFAKELIETFINLEDFSDARKKKLLVDLKTKVYSDQYVFKTNKSIQLLNKNGNMIRKVVG